MKIISGSVLFLSLLLPFSLMAQKAPQEKENKLIANIMSRNAEEGGVLLVEKSAKKILAARVSGDKAEIIGEFPIIYGINEGNKFLRGDGKTPEGIYYVTSYRSGEELIRKYGDYAKIYGSGSFPLNYPNPLDKIDGKTGAGIWIHGRDPINGKDTTQGCVALHNGDLDVLKTFVKIKYPVIIADNLTYSTEEDYAEKRESLLKIFDSFITAWQESDYETFKNLVHEKYRSRTAKNAGTYLAGKKSLMKAYPERVIINDNVRVFIKDPDYLVFDTDQFYCAANLTTYGNKRYYFRTSSEGDLKLVSEEFSSGESFPLIDKAVKDFVTQWAEAWSGRNIDGYMTFYSEKFSDGKRGYEDWKNYKKAVFEKSGPIALETGEVKWRIRNGRYEVTFLQKYGDSRIADTGVKTLALEGCPTQFKIRSETWRAH